jgi:DNA-binding CsgD family transcriptional regulator
MPADQHIASLGNRARGAVFDEDVHFFSLDLINANPQAIFLLDDRGRIATANRAADALLAANDGFVIRHKTIALGNPADNETLQNLIGRALVKGTAGATRALRPSGKRSYSIVVSPLRATNCGQSTEKQPAARLMVVDPEKGALVSRKCLKALYGLTPAEANLAQRLAAAEELKAAAARLGIGYGTARAQLAAIFRKTETRRQGELVRVLCTLPPQLS